MWRITARTTRRGYGFTPARVHNGGVSVSTNGHVPTDRPSEDTVPTGWRWTLPRALGFSAFLAMAVFWIYAFANTSSVEHPDAFEDPVYSAAAEAICAERQANIAEFPMATSATDPEARGPLIELGTAELELMVAELAALEPPTDPEGADGVIEWLDDYDLYLSDRRAYTEVLARGEDEPFLLSANDQGARVTDMLGTFAEVNNMASCAPAGDV